MYAIDHEDLGTPASQASGSVNVQIDGVAIAVPAGTSVLRAAALAGIRVPKLCATDTLKAFGSCRLCLVEVEGRKGYPASCTTQVAEGMSVRTQTDKLAQLRRGVMELYVSDHPLDCEGCPADTHCELQDMAAVVGVRDTPYASGGAMHRGIAHDLSNPYFAFDPNLCIVCSRCVRACDETQGTLALTVDGRGFASRIVASQDEPFLSSECVSCGACVEACPTAALSEKSLAALGQAERTVTTTCGYCGVGCSLNAEVRGDEVVRMVPNRRGGANAGHACVKGRFAYGYTTHADRVTTPMVRQRITDPWVPVSWDVAIGHAAREFKRLQQKYGRDCIGGITSSRCTNEETFLVQKLVRAGFGNNNVDTCARVCHSPTGYGLKHTIGESAGTQAFTSVMKCDVVMLIGANVTDGHPVFASQLKRRLREGAKLIVVDPRAIDIVRTPHISATHHLQLRPGTNVAVMNSIAHVIVTEGLAREDFALARCEPDSWRRWRDFVVEPRNAPEALEPITGVPARAIRAIGNAGCTDNDPWLSHRRARRPGSRRNGC
jgi:formate dehydrogenase major subunit